MWHFGISAGINFNCNPPDTTRSGRYFGALEGCSVISDTSGNLLFYTNNDSVWNRKHVTMPNGYGIGQNPRCGASSTQGSIIIPVPDSDSLFYIFTTDCAESRLARGLRYSIVDMSLNNGYGDVILKNQLLLDSSTEKLAAVHHKNGKDIWVLAKRFWTNNFYAYKISASGLDVNPVISSTGQSQYIGPTFTNPECMARGAMKFSPDGKRIIVCSVSDCHIYPLKPELFKFNDSSGIVISDYTIDDPDSVRYYGASFSPDSKLLYLSTGWYRPNMHQFNVDQATNSSSLLASKTILLKDSLLFNNPPLAAGMCIGPDGKIYFATNKVYLGVIHNPNTPGINCDFDHLSIRLKTCPYFVSTAYSVPNFVESYFRETYMGKPCKDSVSGDFSYQRLCLGDTTLFKDNTISFSDPIQHWSWDFGDPSTGTSNQSELQNPKHKFSQAGVFTVKLTVSKYPLYMACKPVTISKFVIVNDCSEDTTFQEMTICEGDTFIFNQNKYYLEGTYLDTIEGFVKKDSLIMTTLKVAAPSYHLRTFFLCEGDTLKVGKNNYTQAGSYLDTLVSSAGCDSFLTTNLIINPISQTDKTVWICRTDSLLIGNKFFKDSGTYIDTLQTFRGCDSLVSVNLNIFPVNVKDSTIRFCLGDSILIGNQYYFDEQTIFDTLKNVNGCDSVLGIRLTFEDKELCPCENDFRMPNVFTPDADGKNDFYPDKYVEGLELSIYDRWGILVYSGKNKGWDGTKNGQDLPAATYFYIITLDACQGEKQTYNGIVELIR